MKKNILKVLTFALLLALCLNYTSSVLRYKFYDGIYHLDKFYELEEDSVDVLVLGSSHAFGDINPAILYRKYGIAAYDLCASGQAIWNTYYYFKEAIKTQTPKLVVLEAFNVGMESQYSDDSRIIKSNFGLKWSKDKIESIKVSAPEERWGHFATEWIHYHNRYETIKKEDFYGYPENGVGDIDVENWKGFVNYMGTVECVKPTVDASGFGVLPEKGETYYRKIIELAQQNEIPILVVVSPYSSYEQTTAQACNTSAQIAQEYGVPFVNYNNYYEEIGLNFSTDFHDHSHLNYKGSEKYTSVLGEYIIENYQLPDRRGDNEYYSWELNAQYYEKSIDNLEWKEITDLSQYVEHMKENEEEYLYVISLTGQYEKDENIEKIQELSDDEFIILVKDEGEINYIVQKQQSFFYHTELADSDLAVSGEMVIENEDTSSYVQKVIINNVELTNVANGINIVVWDKLRNEIVDKVGFDATNNYQIIRK